MRIAIVTDIHGNLTAFEAVLKDIRQHSPDLILHGGDLADCGAHPVEILDRVRHFEIQGVLGNTDEALFAGLPPSLPQNLENMFAWTRNALGAERLAWLARLPLVHSEPGLDLFHASAASPWRLVDVDSIAEPLTVFGHTHKPFIRPNVANAGSVGQPHDGDQRASYLLLDDGCAQIRRVEYDFESEIRSLLDSGLPHADWMVRILRCAGPTA